MSTRTRVVAGRRFASPSCKANLFCPEGNQNLSGGSPATESGSTAAFLERRKQSAAGIWGRVRETESGCWEWQGAKTPDGYGTVRVGNKLTGAHRAVFQLFHGQITKADVVCHSCNNPACCNPKHLVAGSPADNIRDFLATGGQIGKRKHLLTPEVIAEVCRLRSGGSSLTAIAASLGFDRKTAVRALAKGAQ